MLTYIVRPSVLHDILGISILMEQIGYIVPLSEMKDKFNKFIINEGYDIMVACREHEILGFIAWSKSICFLTSKTRFRIESLVVNKTYRRKGIGKKLVLYLEDYTKQFSSAIIEVISDSYKQKEGLHEFYQKLGYVNESDVKKYYFQKQL